MRGPMTILDARWRRPGAAGLSPEVVYTWAVADRRHRGCGRDYR